MERKHSPPTSFSHARFLADVLNDVLAPIRERRAAYEKDIPGVYKILEEGSKKATQTVLRVRRALGVDYFADKKLIEKQSKLYQKQLAQEAAYAAYLAKQKK